MKVGSIEVAKAAVNVAMTSSRDEEQRQIEELKQKNIRAVAVDIGGNIVDSIPKIIERAIVAARRTHVIKECHINDGAIVGATREAMMQVVAKATGLNAGGKVGIARSGEHISVCIFMSIGLLHLNDLAIGLAHRSIPNE